MAVALTCSVLRAATLSDWSGAVDGRLPGGHSTALFHTDQTRQPRRQRCL